MFVLVHRYVRLDGSAEPSHTHLAPPLRPRRFRPQLNAPSAQLLPDVRADLGAHIQQVCAGLGGSGLPGRPSGLEVCAAARWREASRILWVATDALLIHMVRLVVHRYCIVEYFMFFFIFWPRSLLFWMNLFIYWSYFSPKIQPDDFQCCI